MKWAVLLIPVMLASCNDSPLAPESARKSEVEEPVRIGDVIIEDCYSGYRMNDYGQCEPEPCPEGEAWMDGQCWPSEDTDPHNEVPGGDGDAEHCDESPDDPSCTKDGGTPPTDDESEAEDQGDCPKTGDPVNDDPAVRAGFDHIWAESNPDDSDPNNRRERGMWVVRDVDGSLGVEYFPDSWARGPCEMAVDLSQRPANAIAFVHTHPFGLNEPMTPCPAGYLLGHPMIMRYPSEPSDEDGITSVVSGLPGYIVDREKIVRFEGDLFGVPHAWRMTGHYDRCSS